MSYKKTNKSNIFQKYILQTMFPECYHIQNLGRNTTIIITLRTNKTRPYTIGPIPHKPYRPVRPLV